MTRISFITTCKGRLHHVKETLPRLMEQNPDEVIFVDFDCPDSSGDWVEMNFPAVKVYRVRNTPRWNSSRARNLGKEQASHTWLCFIDADILVNPGFVEWLQHNLHPRCFYRRATIAGRLDYETFGTFICTKEAFSSVHGYDEAIIGWGGEDKDLYDRLKLFNIAEDYYPAHFLKAISHGNELRMKFHKVKDRQLQLVILFFYHAAKIGIMNATGLNTELPLETRKKIQAHIRQEVFKWAEKRSSHPPEITLSTDNSLWLPAPYRIHSKTSIHLKMSQRDQRHAGLMPHP